MFSLLTSLMRMFRSTKRKGGKETKAQLEISGEEVDRERDAQRQRTSRRE
jgi:hypothetical protein